MKSLRFYARSFAIVFFLSAFQTLAAQAATLTGVTVDRSASVASGSGFLDGLSGNLNVSALGPTMTETGTGNLLLPSISFDSSGLGTISFFYSGTPTIPVFTTFLSGSVDDFSSTVGLIEVLFTDTVSSKLYVVDIASAIISGAGISLGAPFVDAQASITVYSATETSQPPAIPLPASGWLLGFVILCAGRFLRHKSAA